MQGDTVISSGAGRNVAAAPAVDGGLWPAGSCQAFGCAETTVGRPPFPGEELPPYHREYGLSMTPAFFPTARSFTYKAFLLKNRPAWSSTGGEPYPLLTGMAPATRRR